MLDWFVQADSPHEGGISPLLAVMNLVRRMVIRFECRVLKVLGKGVVGAGNQAHSAMGGSPGEHICPAVDAARGRSRQGLHCLSLH